MVKPDEIMAALDSRKNKILRLAQAALPPQQFVAFRTLVLDELGNSGFMKDLHQILLKHKDRQG